jgi:hypothetical protein
MTLVVAIFQVDSDPKVALTLVSLAINGAKRTQAWDQRIHQGVRVFMEPPGEKEA